jgi:signal transduction histidine kinase
VSLASDGAETDIEPVRRLPLQEFKNIWKLQRGEVLAVEDLLAQSELSSVESRLLGNGIRSYISVPLIADTEAIGSLNLRWDRPHAFTQEDTEIAREVANQLAVAIRQAQLDKKLRQTNAALQKAMKAKDEMVQNVSHELRTPLTHIIGYSEILTDGVLGAIDEEQLYAINVIHDRARALSELVDTLLSFQTITPQQLDWEDLDIKRLTDDTVRIWQERARREQITLTLEAPGETLPPVRGDYRRLQQALEQLLSNAFKFTGKDGAVHVRVEQREQEIWLSVTDTGVGIPADQLEKIFERFYQVDGSITRSFGGMGIGLSLVQQIIALHNGRIWAESDGIKGHGASLRVALPIASQNQQ